MTYTGSPIRYCRKILAISVIQSGGVIFLCQYDEYGTSGKPALQKTRRQVCLKRNNKLYFKDFLYMALIEKAIV